MAAISLVSIRSAPVSVAASIACLLASTIVITPVRASSATELLITEYVEGSGTNHAIEIYNPTANPVSLSASGYFLAFYFDGDTTIDGGVPLAGVITPGGTWVVTSADAGPALKAKANQSFGTAWFDGNDAVALIHAGTAVDVIGQIGFDPGAAWGTGDTTTADHTLRRKAAIVSGDANGTDAFDPAIEWDAYPQDTFDGLGSVGGSVDQPVSVSCDASMRTVQGVAATSRVTATDPDGLVTTLAVTGVAPADPGTISLEDVAPAVVAGGIAAGTLRVGSTTPAGTWTATVTAMNDATSPHAASCQVRIEVAPVTIDRVREMVDAFVAAGRLDASKADLLRNRLVRAAAAADAGRWQDFRSQLAAFANQAEGLAPRWLDRAAADLLTAEAELLAEAV